MNTAENKGGVDWRETQKIANSSVVQIITKYGSIDFTKPYLPPSDGTSSGSGS